MRKRPMRGSKRKTSERVDNVMKFCKEWRRRTRNGRHQVTGEMRHITSGRRTRTRARLAMCGRRSRRSIRRGIMNDGKRKATTRGRRSTTTSCRRTSLKSTKTRLRMRIERANPPVMRTKEARGDDVQRATTRNLLTHACQPRIEGTQRIAGKHRRRGGELEETETETINR